MPISDVRSLRGARRWAGVPAPRPEGSITEIKGLTAVRPANWTGEPFDRLRFVPAGCTRPELHPQTPQASGRNYASGNSTERSSVWNRCWYRTIHQFPTSSPGPRKREASRTVGGSSRYGAWVQGGRPGRSLPVVVEGTVASIRETNPHLDCWHTDTFGSSASRLSPRRPLGASPSIDDVTVAMDDDYVRAYLEDGSMRRAPCGLQRRRTVKEPEE